MLQRYGTYASSAVRQRSALHLPQHHRSRALRGVVAMASSPDASLAHVQLRVPVNGVEWGESVAVVGSDPRLGTWNVGQAVSMQWTEGHVWVCDVELPAG